MERTFKPTDRGKQVLDQSGARVGTIVGVWEGTAYVRPETDVEEIPEQFDWTDDGGSFLVDADSVARVDESSARLRAKAEPMTQR